MGGFVDSGEMIFYSNPGNVFLFKPWQRSLEWAIYQSMQLLSPCLTSPGRAILKKINILETSIDNPPV